MNKRIIMTITIIGIMYYFRHTIHEALRSKKLTHNVITEKPDPSYYLVNVLDESEFNDAHITNSIHVPYKNVDNFLTTVTDKNIPLIFYCSNYYCTSSDAAAKKAIKKDFKNVWVYKGGMAEWYQTAQKDPSFSYNGPGKAEYLQLVILPDEDTFNPEEDIIDEDYEQTKKTKIINIIDLKNILHQ